MGQMLSSVAVLHLLEGSLNCTHSLRSLPHNLFVLKGPFLTFSFAAFQQAPGSSVPTYMTVTCTSTPAIHPQVTKTFLSQIKYSSMELAVIWGNSDFTHSDFPHSDFAHSDFAHSDFGNFFVKNSYFFHSTFTTWELIWYTCKWNKFDQMELLHIVWQQCPYNTKIIALYPFLNFLSKKKDFLTQTLAPP